MSLRFTSFDAMTKQNKVTALMQILKASKKLEIDYLLALHALADENMSIYLAAKRVIKTFVDEKYYIDLGSKSRSEITETIVEYMTQNIVVKPHLLEIESHSGVRMLAKELQMKQETYETTGKWIGPFHHTLSLLNALRDDTQAIINQLIPSDESIERAYLCFYDTNLLDLRQAKVSLDTTGSAFKTELSSVRSPGQISITLGNLFKLVTAPTYLLVLLTKKNIYLFLREDLREAKAAVFSFRISFIENVTLTEYDDLSTIEVDTPYDLLKFPYMFPRDAQDAVNYIKQQISGSEDPKRELNKDNTINSSHQIKITSAFERELQKLDSLLSSKYMNGETFLLHKCELQNKELSKLITSEDSIVAGSLLEEEPIQKIVMLIDIIGFTGGPAEKHPLKISTLKPVHEKIILPIIKEANGQIIKQVGDCILVLFDNADTAYSIGKSIFTRLTSFNRARGEKIFARITLNTGLVEIRDNSITGKAVNTAIGMTSIATFGHMFLQQSLCNSKDNFTEIGSVKIPEKITLLQSNEIGDEMSKLALEYLNAINIKIGIQIASENDTLSIVKPILIQLEKTIDSYKKGVKIGLTRDKEIEALLAKLRLLLKKY